MTSDIGNYNGFPGENKWMHKDRMVSVTMREMNPMFGEPEGVEVVAAEHETNEDFVGRPYGSGSVQIDSHIADSWEEARKWAKKWMKDNPLPVDADDPESVTSDGDPFERAGGVL